MANPQPVSYKEEKFHIMVIKDTNFLFKCLKDILYGQDPDTALTKLKENLQVLGFTITLKESKIQSHYDVEVFFKKEDCAFQCKYQTFWFFTWWEVRMFDDSL